MAASMKTESIQTGHRIRASLDVREPGPNDHPLHLFVTRNTAKALGISRDTVQFYLSLWTNTKLSIDSPVKTLPPGQGSIFQRMLSNSQNFPEILVPDTEDEIDVDLVESYEQGIDVEIFSVVTVMDADSPREYSEDILLKCSRQYMTHYNISSILVFVRPVSVYPVSNVVIGVSSHETFQWLTKKEFCKNLLAGVKSRSVLVRAKDVFLSAYGGFLDDPDFKRAFFFDIYVLECSPVQQGLITPSTEVVMTYLGDLEREREEFRAKMESLTTNSGKERKQIVGPFKDYLMSDFSQCLNQNYLSPDTDDSKHVPQFKVKARDMKARRGKQDTVGEFYFEVVPQQTVFKRMLWRDQKKPNFDPLYFVGMSRKQMLKLGLFDSSYVLISVSPECVDPDFDGDEEEDTRIPKERLCMVRCLGKEYDRSQKLFISPLCLFNLMKKPPIEVPDQLLMKVRALLYTSQILNFFNVLK